MTGTGCSDRDDPEVIAYLEAENAYTREVLAPLEPLQERLYDEIRARIQETDTSAPEPQGAVVVLQPHRGGPPVRDPLPAGRPRTAPDRRRGPGRHRRGRLRARRSCSTRTRRPATPTTSPSGSSTSAPTTPRWPTPPICPGARRYRLALPGPRPPGRTCRRDLRRLLLLSLVDRQPHLFLHQDRTTPCGPGRSGATGSATPAADRLVYQEDDERFFVSVGLTRSERFVVVDAESKMTSEVHFLDAARPDGPLQVIEPRRQGVEYSAEHARHPDRGDIWLILTNDDGAENFAVVEAPVDAPGKANWRPLSRPPPRGARSTASTPSPATSSSPSGSGPSNACGSSRGPTAPQHVIEQPEPVYSLSGAANPEFASADRALRLHLARHPVLDDRIRRRQPGAGRWSSSSRSSAATTPSST